jgi:hypothetical protein
VTTTALLKMHRAVLAATGPIGRKKSASWNPDFETLIPEP